MKNKRTMVVFFGIILLGLIANHAVKQARVSSWVERIQRNVFYDMAVDANFNVLDADDKQEIGYSISPFSENQLSTLVVTIYSHKYDENGSKILDQCMIDVYTDRMTECVFGKVYVRDIIDKSQNPGNQPDVIHIVLDFKVRALYLDSQTIK